MKVTNNIVVSLFFTLVSYFLYGQETTIKISDYQYNSFFKDRKCNERIRVTAHFSAGEPPRTFIDYDNGRATTRDRDYNFPGMVSKLVVAVDAKDSEGRNFFTRCLRSTDIIQESYEIPIDPQLCDIASTENSYVYEDEVGVDFSFNYQIITKVGVTGNGAYNVSDGDLGYEELFYLTADEGFDESIYQWQYRIGYEGAWINVPRPPSRTLDIRLIDFLDRSVLDQDLFFRIASCDDTDTDRTVIAKSIKEYGQLTKININNYNYTARFDDGRCEDEISLTAYFADGRSPRRFIRHRNARRGRRDDREFVLNGVVTRIDVYMYGKDRVNFGIFGGRRCGRGSLGGRVRETYRINLTTDPCDNRTFDERQSDSNDFIGGNEVRQRLVFDYKVTPLPRVIRTTNTNFMGYEDEFTLNASEGFNNSVYNWQYAFLDDDPLEWTDLPGPSRPTRDIILANYFDESVIGKEIVFRTTSCDNEGSQNVISYRIRRSAPRIINVESTPVSCYDAEDGTVTVTFDRPLIQGDLFSFSISDPSLPEGNVVGNAPNIEAFDDQNKIVIENLPPSSTEFLLEMVGSNAGEVYYTDASYHTATFQIDRPSPVTFVGEPADTAVNVWCFGGQDGAITLTAEGGIGGYEYLIKTEDEDWDQNVWTSFSSSASHTISELLPNTYYMQIRDANGCIAREQTLVDGEVELGDEIIKIVEITEPEAPLTVTAEILNLPTAFGFEDGRIITTINGGTPTNENTYDVEWKDENGVVINTTNAVYNERQGYLVTLHSVGAGSYTVTVKDANYENAEDKEGCTITSETIVLEQPDAIEIALEVTPISCNAQNEFSNNVDTNFDGVPDQFQDGVIVATVTGGVRYNIENPDFSAPYPTNAYGDLLPYFYTWKMQLPDGSWQDMNINDSVIDFLDTATNYSLNVTDSNGIEVGNYTAVIQSDGSISYNLVAAEDVIEYVSQPEPLELTFTSSIVTCANGDDASAQVTVTGGVAPYTYEWSNGTTSATIDNLIAGNYLVFVTDSKECQIEGTITIEQSNSIEIESVSVLSPTCFEGEDGQIAVSVSGGSPPYSYSWNNGATTDQLQGLSSGVYRMEVTDNSGCKAFYEEILTDPDPVIIDLEDKRSLCGEQALTLNIAIDDPEAVYSWSGSNGFTSSNSEVILTETGRYIATVTTGRGCVGIGEVEVEAFDRPIDADFLITTQAYTGDDVVLINVSNPMGEKVDWTIPEGVQIISESLEELTVNFEAEGAYDIHMRSYQGDCFQDYVKTVLVQPAVETPDVSSSRRKFIEEFIVYPNPSEGVFKTKISLTEASNINVKIMDLVTGAIMDEYIEKDKQEFLLDYSISMPTGIYLMLLETPKGSETRKLIVE